MNNIKIIFFSGAGLSAESGIPTFRSENGVWENYDIDTVCNFRTWESNVETIHRFYNQMRCRLPEFEPNEAHKAIARVQKQFGKNQVLVITQNVDDLLERAGCEGVLHVHGEITKMRCLDCGYTWDIGYQPYDGTSCPKCHEKKVKPDIIFFYEKAPMYDVLMKYLNHINKNTTVIVIGTSGSVVPIDYMLEEIDAKMILNNMEVSADIDEQKYEHIFYEKATSALPKIEFILLRRYAYYDDSICV